MALDLVHHRHCEVLSRDVRLTIRVGDRQVVAEPVDTALPTALGRAGWSVMLTERHPDWLEAQLRLYAAASAAPSWDDPAVQRLRDEGGAVAPAIRHGERLMIQAYRD